MAIGVFGEPQMCIFMRIGTLLDNPLMEIYSPTKEAFSGIFGKIGGGGGWSNQHQALSHEPISVFVSVCVCVVFCICMFILIR